MHVVVFSGEAVKLPLLTAAVDRAARAYVDRFEGRQTPFLARRLARSCGGLTIAIRGVSWMGRPYGLAWAIYDRRVRWPVRWRLWLPGVPIGDPMLVIPGWAGG